MNTKTFSRLALVLAFTILASATARAETTALVNYQGKLKKAGTNVNGEVTVIFKIFTGETNEACVFEETQQVTVVDGLYSTLIGKNPTLGNIEDSAKLDDAFLEVTVNGTKLKPREKFTPPPFAKKSEERWNLTTVGWWDYAAQGFFVNFSTPQFGTMIHRWGTTNCTRTIPMIVFPAPATSIRVASAKAFITMPDNFWAHPDLNPYLIMRLTARTLTNSVRGIGPDLVFTPTNTPAFNSWFTLPLSTNQTDLSLQTSELLCLEMPGSQAGTIPDNCALLFGTNTFYMLLDVRVR